MSLAYMMSSMALFAALARGLAWFCRRSSEAQAFLLLFTITLAMFLAYTGLLTYVMEQIADAWRLHSYWSET